MSIPMLLLYHNCKGSTADKLANEGAGKICGLACLDALTSITCLVIGILALTSVISMPPAAAWALIGISGFITFLWAFALCGCCRLPSPKSNSAY